MQDLLCLVDAIMIEHPFIHWFCYSGTTSVGNSEVFILMKSTDLKKLKESYDLSFVYLAKNTKWQLQVYLPKEKLNSAVLFLVKHFQHYFSHYFIFINRLWRWQLLQLLTDIFGISWQNSYILYTKELKDPITTTVPLRRLFNEKYQICITYF